MVAAIVIIVVVVVVVDLVGVLVVTVVAYVPIYKYFKLELILKDHQDFGKVHSSHQKENW